jgi:hypothetical protein
MTLVANGEDTVTPAHQHQKQQAAGLLLAGATFLTISVPARSNCCGLLLEPAAACRAHVYLFCCKCTAEGITC